jgi:DMSO reductase family type II enzyme chaperone
MSSSKTNKSTNKSVNKSTNKTDLNGKPAAGSPGEAATGQSQNVLSELEGEEQISAAARSQIYALVAQALSYPDDELCEWIRAGGVSDPLRQQLPLGMAAAGGAIHLDWDALRNPGRGEVLALEYTRLFDAGAKGPPCPLYGGLYGDARMMKMEEAVRFYNHFGLSLSEEQRELPDHLVTQLEFLHYLCYREVEALQQGLDPGPFRRAQRDFIQRNPGNWVPQLCEKLAKEEAAPFFITLLGGLADLLATEGARLADTP